MSSNAVSMAKTMGDAMKEGCRLQLTSLIISFVP